MEDETLVLRAVYQYLRNIIWRDRFLGDEQERRSIRPIVGDAFKMSVTSILLYSGPRQHLRRPDIVIFSKS